MNTTPRVRTASLALALLLAGVAAPAPARATWTFYNAAFGTLPHDQGWTITEQITPLVPYTATVGAGDLYLSTTGFGSNVPPDNGGGVWWSRDDVSFDFSADFAVEARVRIVQSPDRAINTVTGWPRPGYLLALYDATGRQFWIGLGTGEVFLSNTAYGQYGSANTVTAAFNTTDGHHVYRIERAAGGVGAALRIDGVLTLQLPTLGPVESGGGLVYFGDGTYWANSESYTSWVRFTGNTLGVEPASPGELLWAKPARNPAPKLRLAFRSRLGGTLSFEVFDLAGRRVERAEREVAAGEEGTFTAEGAHGSGLYAYRVRLVSPSGTSTETTGRLVLVR